ncbi:hypothetical protein QJQ45_018945, partial [Haematococcus lacustris]
MQPYRLECGLLPISPSLGAPDFHPLSLGHAEDSITDANIKEGYRDTAAAFGIEEAQEAELSLFRPAVNAGAVRQRLYSSLQAAQAQQCLGPSSTVSRQPPATNPPSTAPCVLLSTRERSEEEIIAWLRQLASCRSPHAMAASLPRFKSRSQLLHGLWHARVPCLHAVWLIKRAYQHWSHSSKAAVEGVGPPQTPDSSPPPSQLCAIAWTSDILDLLTTLLPAVSASIACTLAAALRPCDEREAPQKP